VTNASDINIRPAPTRKKGSFWLVGCVPVPADGGLAVGAAVIAVAALVGVLVGATDVFVTVGSTLVGCATIVGGTVPDGFVGTAVLPGEVAVAGG
jgi:hypothetical protein